MREPNKHYRVREYLTPKEVEALIKAARGNRYGLRDSTMILMAYRHALRNSEVRLLRWDQIDLSAATILVVRAKCGVDTTHPLGADELRALGRLKKKQESGRYVFVSDRGAPMGESGFQHLVTRLGKKAKLPFSVHPHMLRHACGYKLANDGHDTRALQHYLGHKNIQHTVRYTDLSPERFQNFWRD